MLIKQCNDFLARISWQPLRSFVMAVTAGTCVVGLLPAILVLSDIHLDNWRDLTRIVVKMVYVLGIPMIFVTTAMILVCLPLTWFLHRFGLEYWFIYLFFGGVTGFIVMRLFLAISFSINDGLFLPTVGALSGAVAGITWWATRRDGADRQQETWLGIADNQGPYRRPRVSRSIRSGLR